MTSLKQLKQRINSIRSTRKITSTLKLVSTSKFRREKVKLEKFLQFRKSLDYAKNYLSKHYYISSKAEEEIHASFKYNPQQEEVNAATTRPKHHLMVVITSDKGLCGNLNSLTLRKLEEHIAELKKNGITYSIISIGKKGEIYFQKNHKKHVKEYMNYDEFNNNFHSISSCITAKTMEMHEEFDMCTIHYISFKSTIKHLPTAQVLLPSHLSYMKDEEVLERYGNPISETPLEMMLEGDDIQDIQDNFVLEPDSGKFLNTILPEYLGNQIFGIILENHVCEHLFRMNAMEGANKNSLELLKALELQHNRMRQTNITNGLIEIISSVESMS